MLNLGAEDSALLLTCRPYTRPEDDQALSRLAESGNLNWNYLLWRSENNRTLPLLHYHLERLGLLRYAPIEAQEYLKRWILLSEIRSVEQFRSLVRVIEAFDQEGIAFFLLKGSALALLYSPDPLMRPMQDLDLMIHVRDSIRAQSVLFELGYSHGIFDPATGVTTPVEKRITSESLRDHHGLPAFMKVVRRPSPLALDMVPKGLRYKHVKCYINSQNELLVPLFMDLHITLSVGLDIEDVWAGLHLEKVLDRVVRVQSLTGMLWFIAARVYHEAFEFNTFKLLMLGDVHTLIHRGDSEIDWAEILSIAFKYEMRPALYYVLTQVKATMGAAVPDVVLQMLRPDPREIPLEHDWGDLMPKLFAIPTVNQVNLS